MECECYGGDKISFAFLSMACVSILILVGQKLLVALFGECLMWFTLICCFENLGLIAVGSAVGVCFHVSENFGH